MSSRLLETALLRRPCEKGWLPTTRTRVTPCAVTRSELHRLLPQILLQTDLSDTDIKL
jgi:hypothetical protein